MNLNLFPPTIADLERALLRQNQTVRELKARLEACDRALDRAIAFDPELRNDAMRKAKRAEVADDPDYQRLVIEVQKAAEITRLIEIDLDLTKNQFAVAKLETRERIARLEAVAA